MIEDILHFAVENNASDIHFSSGHPPILRIKGQLRRVEMDAIPHDILQRELLNFLDDTLLKKFKINHGVDFAYSIQDLARFRINIYQQLYGIAAAFRVIPHTIRTVDELMLPPVIKLLCRKKKGLILVTGPTGSGKSTTLAAMLHEINTRRKEHIITIEDPIEYIHKPINCLIHQRELGVHVNSYSDALVQGLREDPDVILVGEMRDLETIQHALLAAETGQLVLSTLHTNTAAETIDRIIDVFPSEQQRQIRNVLSNVLQASISQRLVPQAFANDRAAISEILLATSAVKNLIREEKIHQIPSAIQTGFELGMQTFERSLEQMKKNNIVSPEVRLQDYV
ncbi:MAG: type IV pilus twitching motility protein PilT [Calditrichia bacterium]